MRQSGSLEDSLNDRQTVRINDRIEDRLNRGRGGEIIKYEVK